MLSAVAPTAFDVRRHGAEGEQAEPTMNSQAIMVFSTAGRTATALPSRNRRLRPLYASTCTGIELPAHHP